VSRPDFRPPPFLGAELILEALQRSSTQARLSRLAARVGVDELMGQVEAQLRERLAAELVGRTLDDSLRDDVVRIVDEVLDEIARAGADA
jgi:hypothetical protein